MWEKAQKLELMEEILSDSTLSEKDAEEIGNQITKMLLLRLIPNLKVGVQSNRCCCTL